MFEFLSAAVMTVMSGLLGAGITLWWTKKQSERKDKIDILTVLLSYRGRTDINALSYISPAINRIPVVFSNDSDVLNEVNNFINKRMVFDFEKKSQPEKDNIRKEMDESYTKLVGKIAECLNYKNISFDVVSNPYNPQGVGDYFSLQDEKMRTELAIIKTFMGNQGDIKS